MEKYIYDFIADQEPDGNSEWYPAKEVDKEIDWLKEENANLSDECIGYTKEIKRLMNQVRTLNEVIIDLDKVTKEKDKEIERLRNISEEINDYDPGILNDYGGGNIDWWMDYIRSEIDRCNEYWRQVLKEGE